MAYIIRSRDLDARTMVIYHEETKQLNNMPMPPKEVREGTPEFDAYIEEKLTEKSVRPSWYNEPGDANPFKRTIPVVDLRRSR